MALNLTAPTYFELPRPEVLPSPNGAHGHWSSAHTLTSSIRVDWAVLAASQRHGKRLGPCPAERRKLRLCLVHGPGQRRLDKDNAYRAMKPIVDSLVDAKWLYLDSEKWLDYDLTQDEGPKGLIRVLIAPVNGGE